MLRNRYSAIVLLFAGVVLGIVNAPARAGETAFNVPAGDLGSALREFGRQSNQPILFSTDVVQGKVTKGVKGSFEADSALAKLLTGTGLTFTRSSDGSLLISRADGQGASAPPTPVPGGASNDHSSNKGPAINQDDGARLEEIVVTAQKRQENLQSVPVSVQVIGSEALQTENQNNLTDLARTVPDVHVSTLGKSNALYIRGVGAGENPTFDQAVATFSDDIYHGRSRMSEASFLDVDRIEILKGPQSTFFGDNAIAGALNIVSKKPGDELDGYTRVLYGMFDQYAVESAVGGPLTDTLGARVALTANGGNGWLTNVADGERVPITKNWAGRVTLVYKPVEDLEIALKFEGGKHKTEGAAEDEPFQINNCPHPPYPATYSDFGTCATVLSLGVPIGINQNKFADLPGQGNTLSNYEPVLTVNYRNWGNTFTSVTGYSHYSFFEDVNAVPGNPVPYYTNQWSEHYNQLSQEFRVTSASQQPIEYVAGVYFQTDQLAYDQINDFEFFTPIFESIPQFSPLVPYLPLGYSNGVEQRERVYSAFGSLTWNVTDRLKISGGLRGSAVDKGFDAFFYLGQATQTYGGFIRFPPDLESLAHSFFSGVIPSLGNSPHFSSSNNALMPSARIQYQVSPDLMTYFRFDRGFLAGGFNGADVYNFNSGLAFGPEYVNAYEVGLKSKWFDDTVLLNVAAFRSDYTGLQVSTSQFECVTASVCGYSTAIRNAASSVSQGLELEGQWAATKQLRLGANVVYLDSHYVSFPNAGPTILQGYCNTLSSATPECPVVGAAVPLSSNQSGQRTAYAPRLSGSLTAGYTLNIGGDYRFMMELAPYFTSNYVTLSGDPTYYNVAGYVRLDGRLSLQSPTDKWALDLIGKNLTDRTIIDVPFPLYNAAKEEPRNVALQFRYKW